MAFLKEDKNNVENKKQDNWVFRESTLFHLLKSFLERKNYKVFSEVPFPTSFSFIDVVAINGDSIICIEMKWALSDKVIRQAYYSKMITKNVFVCVGTNPTKKSIEKCKKYGIGILSIKEGSVNFILAPDGQNEPFLSYVQSIKETVFNGGFNGVAGLPNMKGTGPAQSVLKLVEEERLKNPNISWKELWKMIPNHYSSHLSMAQAMKMAKDRQK